MRLFDPFRVQISASFMHDQFGRPAAAVRHEKPDLAEAWLGRGNVFFDLKRYDEAFAAYDKALALKPDL